jgi:uncharacterized protein (TIGR03066 family)
MRRGMLVIGVLCVGLSFAAAQIGPPAKLIGSWEAVTGGLPMGSTLTFAKDGKALLTLKLKGNQQKIEGTYTLKDNAISTKMSFAGKESVEVHKIKKLTDTELHTEDKDGKIDEFKKAKDEG